VYALNLSEICAVMLSEKFIYIYIYIYMEYMELDLVNISIKNYFYFLDICIKLINNEINLFICNSFYICIIKIKRSLSRLLLYCYNVDETSIRLDED